jgi:tetratricopeptide (TPR) repeat protein
VATLRKVISQPMLRHEQREVKANAHLTLGLIYYELGYYQEAIAHLRTIKEENRDYPQALLTRSWASIKMNDFQNAVVTLNELIKKYDASEFGEEAHFLLGQSYLKLEFYDFAVKEYDYIIARYPEGNNISEQIAQVEAGLRQQEHLLERLKVRLLVLESKLIDSIRMEGAGRMPKYIQDHYEQLARSKDQLIENILTERKTFLEVASSLEQVRSELVRKESRRHWRAYAEYGKARALFLKGMPKQN